MGCATGKFLRVPASGNQSRGWGGLVLVLGFVKYGARSIDLYNVDMTKCLGKGSVPP